MQNEQHLTILGFRLWRYCFGVGLWPKEGDEVSVQMDVEKAMRWRKWIIGMWHSHPTFLNYPSGVDKQTFYTWSLTLGKPLFCLITGIDAEKQNGEKAIGNYKFTTYPFDEREHRMDYSGYAVRAGRLFFWRDNV